MTLEELSRDALASVGSEAGVLLGARWVKRRYDELCSLGQPRHLRRTVEVVIPAAVRVGSAAIARGSRRLYGDATALASWHSFDPVGRYVRTRLGWYRVTALGSEYITLDSPFAEDDHGTVPSMGVDLAGSAYWIVQRYVDVPLRRVIAATHVRRFRGLNIVSASEMATYGDRMPLTTGPMVMSEYGEATNQGKLYEVYPYSDEDETIEVTGYALPPDLKLRDTLPSSIDPYVLIEGTLVDVMRYESGKAARMGNTELAAYWRNEYRAQETRWSEFKRHAYRTDLGVDDLGFYVASFFPRGRRDIATARDEIYARGRRP